jgi:DNA invertase Pin-like site-specific DNA recombinase
MGIDTRTPMGKATAHMAVVVAELERDFIRSRTREALAVRRDHGVVLRRPRSTLDDVVARVSGSADQVENSETPVARRTRLRVAERAIRRR